MLKKLRVSLFLVSIALSNINAKEWFTGDTLVAVDIDGKDFKYKQIKDLKIDEDILCVSFSNIAFTSGTIKDIKIIDPKESIEKEYVQISYKNKAGDIVKLNAMQDTELYCINKTDKYYLTDVHFTKSKDLNIKNHQFFTFNYHHSEQSSEAFLPALTDLMDLKKVDKNELIKNNTKFYQLILDKENYYFVTKDNIIFCFDQKRKASFEHNPFLAS